jgi:energy-coupling factor transporter ATP-binding protein EcfA2
VPAALVVDQLFKGDRLARISQAKGAFLGKPYSSLKALMELVTSNKEYMTLFYQSNDETMEQLSTGLMGAILAYVTPDEAEEQSYVGAVKYLLDNTFPIWGRKEGDNMIFDRKEGRIYNSSYGQIHSVLGGFPKKVGQAYRAEGEMVEMVYLPTDEVTWQEPDNDRRTYNRYLAPTWRKYTGEPVDISLFVKLWNHVFPSEESKQLAGSWIKAGIIDRKKNQTFLHLCGPRGTGKSTICQILDDLAGDSNTGRFSQGFHKTHFNSFLMNKHFVCMEDIPIDLAMFKYLKSIADDKQSFNIKNKNTDGTSYSPTIFVISTNEIPDTYNEPTNRRGLMPVMGEIDATKTGVFTSDQMRYLTHDLDDAYLHTIAAFFDQYPENKCTTTAPKTRRFRETVLGTCPRWLHILKELISEGGEKPYKDARKMVSRELKSQGAHRSSSWPTTTMKVIEKLKLYNENDFPMVLLEGDSDREKDLVFKPFQEEELI